MVTPVAVPGGWELMIMFLIQGTLLTAALLLVYLVVRLASRPRPFEDEHN